MKTKFVKLSKHSFVRIYDDGKLGYVINQKTELDRVYDNIGADFLSQLKREPRSFDDIADELLSLYKNTDRQLIYDDLQTFIYELLNYKFVVVADSIEETIGLMMHLFQNFKKQKRFVMKILLNTFGSNMMLTIHVFAHFI